MRPICMASPVRRGRRPGVALMGALVILAVVSTLMVSIGWNIVANRRLEERRHQQLQARWLAAGGIDLAAADLLAAPARFKGETLKPIPRGELSLTVEREADSLDVYRVVSEAHYPTDVPNGVTLSVARRFRRATDGDQVRIEMLPD